MQFARDMETELADKFIGCMSINGPWVTVSETGVP